MLVIHTPEGGTQWNYFTIFISYTEVKKLLATSFETKSQDYRLRPWNLKINPKKLLTLAQITKANQIDQTTDKTESNEVIPRTNCHDHSTQYLIFLHAHTSHYHVTQWGNFTATSHTAQTDTNWLNTIRFKLSFNLFLTIIATLSIMCKIC